MTEDECKIAIEKLRTALSEVKQGKEAEIESCEALIAQIENHMRYPDTDAEIDSLIESVKKQASLFEVDHPNLTKMMRDLINIFGNMGI